MSIVRLSRSVPRRARPLAHPKVWSAQKLQPTCWPPLPSLTTIKNDVFMVDICYFQDEKNAISLSHIIPIPLASNRMSPDSLETLVAQLLLGFAGFCWGIGGRSCAWDGTSSTSVGGCDGRFVGTLWSQRQLSHQADWADATKIDPDSLKYTNARWDQTARPSHLAPGFLPLPAQPVFTPSPVPPSFSISGQSRTPPCSVHARPRFR